MLPINIPDPAQNTLGGHGASSVGSVVQEAGGVSDGVDDGLGVFLERREITDIESHNHLAIQNLATLQNLKKNKAASRLTVGSSSVL